ncbi:37S ribosomal protein S9, mitochondrial [Malassezia cuniculi]|uniref:Small ribosomal subunit protein uS9m n=1 Tax=Malassezia cuniculi TaxID=948313 RepID=A0AAF0ESE9_9BASI|nr:37S ribosomal protein S9, mitochondrial [Malassezia cuniculi]
MLHAARSLVRVPFGMRALSTSVRVCEVQRTQRPRRYPMPVAPMPDRPKPASPTFYTTKPSYNDTLQMLDQLVREVKRALEQAYIVAPNARPPPLPQGPTNIWVSRGEMSSRLGLSLRASQYRSILSRLTLLLRYRELVNEHLGVGSRGAAEQQLVAHYDSVLGDFAAAKNVTEASTFSLKTQSRTRGMIDKLGRAYARGRRKVSSANVWVARAKDGNVGRILVNGVPLAEYFSRTEDREAVTWPLKLAGVLGAYNVFALARGGGSSGQAGAIAHGMSNALVTSLAHADFPDAERIALETRSVLSKDGVLNRDPRMVERKKPGLAKARKAYTWVKR